MQFKRNSSNNKQCLPKSTFRKSHFIEMPFVSPVFNRNDSSQMQFKRNSFYEDFLTESIHMKTTSRVGIEQNSF